MEIALKFYTTVSLLTCRKLYVRQAIFFNFCTWSVIYKKPSIMYNPYSIRKYKENEFKNHTVTSNTTQYWFKYDHV